MSWLAFNERVMMQAADKSVPLFERMKFLSIYYSNLDEFFMVRVGSVMHRAMFLPEETDPRTGRTSDEELKKILAEVSVQQKKTQEVYDALLSDLAKSGIEKVDFKHLSKSDEIMTKKLFTEYKDLLSPRVIDQQHPMPFLTGGECYSALVLLKNGREKLGLVSLYRLPKYKSFESEDGTKKIVIVAELINYYVQSLFKKYTVTEKCLIRITRNADVFFEDYEKDDRQDSRIDMQKLLKKRKRSMPVRLQICGKPSSQLVDMLKTECRVTGKQIFVGQIPFDVDFHGEVSALPGYKYTPRKPVKTISLAKGEFGKYLESNDILLSFPYQSITPFIDLVYEAADDPSVESISITLYRLAASSRLAAALAYAADRGKEVLCLLELRARFDEQNNIDYSEVLEEAGCSIIYGLENMKVHSKLMLIKKRSADGKLSYITQLGTGNYNEVTSELYTDISVITADPGVGKDADDVFKALAMGEVPPDTENLILAPLGFKPRLLRYLDEQIRLGSEGRVSIKVNSLNDTDVMMKLIECSRAGVKVELFIRGICCLKPGIAGMTDNISVKSIIGRYLEHSRIYVFGTGKDRRIFVGSGDLLSRNTERRVEAFIELKAKNTQADAMEIMEAFRDDIDNSWIMQPDGSYQKLPSAAGRDSFERLYGYFTKQLIAMPVAPGRAKKLFKFKLWKKNTSETED